MPPTSTRGSAISLIHEVSAGLASAVAVAGVPITLGILVYSSVGAAAGSVGIPAAFWTVAIGGATALLFSNARMPALGPTSATALILAALVGRIAADPAFDATQNSHLAALVAAASSAVALMGLLVLSFGFLRLGGLITYVPRPVLSGFMNGVALMIIVMQLPSLVGVSADAGQAASIASLANAQPVTLGIGAATLAIAWLVARLRPRWPVVLVAMIGGTLLHHAIVQLFPTVSVGGLIGQLPQSAPVPDALLPLATDAMGLFEGHWRAIATTGAVLAVISSLESLLNIAAIDLQTNHRTDPNRDLRAVGVANLVGAFFGSLPGLQLRVRANAILQLGGKTRVAALFSSLGSLAILILAAPLIALLPTTVLAAVMIAIAFALMDRWSMQLIGRWRAGDTTPDLLPSLLIVVAVLLVTVFAGYAVAVALGIVLSMVLFIRSLNRGLVRSRWRGEDRPSRRIYPLSQEQALRTLRQQIEGIDVDGVLYFGSEQRLSLEVDRRRPATRFLILDLHRLSTIEASGVTLISELVQRLASRNLQLTLAGPRPEPLRALGAFGGPDLLQRVYPDADRATEAAERLLLGEAGIDSDARVELEQSLLFHGLDRSQCERMRQLLVPRHLSAGEQLFAEGDAGDALYVVVSGSVALLSGNAKDGQRSRHRFVSASPGMMLGEVAVLDGAGRTADAVAESDATVYRLSAEHLSMVRERDPELAALLLVNISIHLSQRLRAAASAWREQAA